MMKEMKAQSPLVFFFFFFFLFFFSGSILSVGAATLGEKCSKDFQEVTKCLSFATGKAATPTKECCGAVTGIRDSDPACLCYFIQQTHNGSQEIKSLGIQEARLLQLPSACQIVGSNITECPKLLGILPGSPGYDIFTNASSSATPTTPVGTSQPEKTDDSNGTKHCPHLAGLLVIAVATYFYAFPSWICLYV